MRISSKFRDYYDFVADQYGGGDPRIVYPRTRLTKIDPKNPWSGDLIVTVPKWGPLPDPNGYYRSDEFQYRYLIVAGKAYLLKRLQSMFYDGDINSFKICNAEEEVKDRRRFYLRQDKFEYGKEHDFLVDLSRQIKAPVFVINKLEYVRLGKDEVSAIIDGQCPVLGRIGMASLIDPYQMYQELALFVGNKMRSTPDVKPPVELDNKQKILKAGFDLKKSFRHRT